MHARRRSAAVEKIRRRDVRRVNFLCNGNICRSPFAEYLFRNVTGVDGGVIAESAGFIGPNRPSPPEALEAARRFGVDLRDHRSKLIDRAAVARADLLVVMSGNQARMLVRRFGAPRDRIILLGDLDPERIERRAIHDPVEQELEVFVTVYDRIRRCIEVLVAARPRGGRVRERVDV